MIKRNDTVTNVKNKRPLSGGRSYLLVFLCGALLLSGFFFAGQQHFASMDFGMKNSRLRRQIDQLEAEKQRLIHAREVSLSPAEVKKAAKKAGLLDAPISNQNVIASADPVEMKAAGSSRPTNQPFVQKISAINPARSSAGPPEQRPAATSRKAIASR